MPNYIPGRFGRSAHSAEIRELLGLPPNAKLPADGMPSRYIQGFRVYVRPLDPATSRRRVHRVRAVCMYCHADISAGRIGQHMRVHSHLS